jgi:hypothetical protein
MKKLKLTIPDGGAPLGQFPVIRELFDEETKDAIEAMLSTVIIGQTEGVILSGCLATGTAGNFAISAGYIFVDGLVLRYPGTSGHSATQYLKIATATEESGVFADGGTKAYIDVNTAINFSTSGGGTGTQYITLAFATAGITLASRIGDILNDNIVTTAKILDSNVTANKLATNAVTSVKINALAVTTAKIDALAVTLAKMAANSVDSDQYVDGSIDDVHLANDKVTSVGVQLLIKVVDIGDWDMDADSAPAVAPTHGLTVSKIRSVSALIRDDAGTGLYDIGIGNTVGTSLLNGSVLINGANIQLHRVTPGDFDNTSFDTSSSYNRGFVTIIYEA